MSQRKLPPLSALRAFEAAARHESAKRAAEELSVTATAISHQIRSLEESLGVALFVRKPRKLELTASGRELKEVLEGAFDSISAVVEPCGHPDHDAGDCLTLAAVLGVHAARNPPDHRSAYSRFARHRRAGWCDRRYRHPLRRWSLARYGGGEAARQYLYPSLQPLVGAERHQ